MSLSWLDRDCENACRNLHEVHKLPQQGRLGAYMLFNVAKARIVPDVVNL